MRKNLLVSCISSVSISTILLVLNRIYAAITGNILGMRVDGAEIVEVIGFGWREFTFYPEMRVEELATWEPTTTLEFHLLSYVVMLLVVFFVTLIIGKIISRKKS